MVNIGLLSFFLSNRLAQRPPNPVQNHVPEQLDSPIAPIRVPMAKRRRKAAATTFTFIGPGDDIVSVGDVDLNEWDRLRQEYYIPG